jgi:tetrahydromethanopterin S-methyltransferase subunit B
MMNHDGIYIVYPNVTTVFDNKNGSVTAYDKDRNIVTIDMDLVNAKNSELEAEIEQAKQDAETKKASGKQKLKDLGLTDDEIQALIGV